MWTVTTVCDCCHSKMALCLNSRFVSPFVSCCLFLLLQNAFAMLEQDPKSNFQVSGIQPCPNVKRKPSACVGMHQIVFCSFAFLHPFYCN